MNYIKQGSVWRSRDRRETRSITILSESATRPGMDVIRVQSGPRSYEMRVNTLVRRYDPIQPEGGR